MEKPEEHQHTKAPVGNALFVAIKVGRTTLGKTMPYMLCCHVAILTGLAVTCFPFLSPGLPQMTGLIELEFPTNVI